MFCGVFVEDKKLDSNLHISSLLAEVSHDKAKCLHLGKNLDFVSAFGICLLVYQDKWFVSVPNYTTEWFDVYFSRMHFVRILCKEYHVIVKQ